MRLGGQRHVLPDLPLEHIRYPLYKRLSGTQGRSNLMRKISPTQGFDSRIAQTVAISYIDWVIQATQQTTCALQNWSSMFTCLINIQNANYSLNAAQIYCELSVDTALSTCYHRLTFINTILIELDYW